MSPRRLDQLFPGATSSKAGRGSSVPDANRKRFFLTKMFETRTRTRFGSFMIAIMRGSFFLPRDGFLVFVFSMVLSVMGFIIETIRLNGVDEGSHILEVNVMMIVEHGGVPEFFFRIRKSPKRRE